MQILISARKLEFLNWLHLVAVPYEHVGLPVGKGEKKWRTSFIPL